MYRRGRPIPARRSYEVHAAQVPDEARPLFDRGRDIRLRIATPTRITGNMVSSAPYSDPVADEVLRWIRGRVIVAHNARFDRGSPSRQLAEAIGGVPQVERLCTLAIACCIAPRLRHWTLLRLPPGNSSPRPWPGTGSMANR